MTLRFLLLRTNVIRTSSRRPLIRRISRHQGWLVGHVVVQVPRWNTHVYVNVCKHHHKLAKERRKQSKQPSTSVGWGWTCDCCSLSMGCCCLRTWSWRCLRIDHLWPLQLDCLRTGAGKGAPPGSWCWWEDQNEAGGTSSAEKMRHLRASVKKSSGYATWELLSSCPRYIYWKPNGFAKTDPKSSLTTKVTWAGQLVVWVAYD